MARRLGKDLLTPDDWARAALEAIAEGGVAGVAVDRLARRLGASRGSFYWHFADRQNVIDAALALWERESTTDRIPALEEIEDPVARLRVLLREVYERPVDAVELALSTAGTDPAVMPVFARVTRRRLDVLLRIFRDLGLAEDAAAERAWLAYAFYLGHHQLGRNRDVRERRPADLEGIVGVLSAR